jgi:hypothetical protein
MEISGIKYPQLAKSYNLPPQSQIGTEKFKEAILAAIELENKKTKLVKTKGIVQDAVPAKYIFYYDED